MAVARILPTQPCDGLAIAAPSMQAHHAAQVDHVMRGDSVAEVVTWKAMQPHMDAIAKPFPAKAA